MLEEEGAEVTVDTISACPRERNWLEAGQYLQLVSVDRAGSDHKDDQDKVLPGTSSILFVPFMSLRLRQPPGKKCHDNVENCVAFLEGGGGKNHRTIKRRNKRKTPREKVSSRVNGGGYSVPEGLQEYPLVHCLSLSSAVTTRLVSESGHVVPQEADCC